MTDQPNIADMAAFGASEYACYRWPDDTAEHRALRAAYCHGAAHAASGDAPGVLIPQAVSDTVLGRRVVDFIDQHDPFGDSFCRHDVTRIEAALSSTTRFTPGDPVEIRKQNDEIDEIVIRRGDVHIEQMSADGWFMGVNGSDGSYWQFWFGSKNRKSHVEFRHTEHVTAEEERENRPAITSTRPPDIESFCEIYAARWCAGDWFLWDDDDKADLRIEAHRWLKCWAAVSSTDDKSPVSYCALCDLEHPLDEDAQGFHHVIKGERVQCSAFTQAERT